MKRIKLLITIISLSMMFTPITGSVSAQVGPTKTLLDPNLAAEKQLLSLPHMNATIAKSLIERRPFLNMRDLDSFLGQSLNAKQRTELYGKLFLHLNLNSASKEEILLIPGVGEKMLHEFLEYRPYKNLAQFHREIRKYVDEAEVNRLKQYVFVPVQLNTATDEEILSIPGMGRKMLHEFKEYRPYKNIEQFRREIGKYVDAKEVARLERYVTLN